MKRPLIILTGPTAVGKTALSIQLAKAIGGEIISADSMQVYQYMDIGSAKIRRDEMDGVPHYLVDVLKPEEDFHVVRFQEMAKEAMEKIYANNHIPIVVGGTGFYIQALLYDIDFTESDSDASYLWVRGPEGATSWDLFDRLLQYANIVTTPGSGFGEGGEGFIRISLTAGDDALSNALDRLARLALF